MSETSEILGTPSGSPHTIKWVIGIAILLLAVIFYLHPVFFIIGVLFLLVNTFNAFYAMKHLGYWKVSEARLSYCNNYWPKWNRSFAWNEVDFVDFRSSGIKMNTFFEVEIVTGSQKKHKFKFEGAAKNRLIVLQEWLAHHHVAYSGNLQNVRVKGGAWDMPIYSPALTIGPLLLVAFFYWLGDEQTLEENQQIVAKGKYAIAVTTGLGEMQHARYPLEYEFEVDGNTYRGSTRVVAMYTKDKKRLWLDPRDQKIYIPVTNAFFTVAYAANNPVIHRVLLHEPRKDMTDTVGFAKRKVSMESLKDY